MGAWGATQLGAGTLTGWMADAKAIGSVRGSKTYWLLGTDVVGYPVVGVSIWGVLPCAKITSGVEIKVSYSFGYYNI